MAVEHTPGPWKVQAAEREEDGSVYPARIVGGERELVICYLTDLSQDEMHEADGDVRSKAANVSLIEAAPDLREAVIDLLRIIHAVCPEYDEATVCSNARIALAKADRRPAGVV